MPTEAAERPHPTLASPSWRAALILGLYGYQGLVAGFAVTALPNAFAAMGASAEEVGAHLALVGLPWIAQPLWGPVVDRFGGFRMGRRRAWVAGAFLLCLASLSLLLLVGDLTRERIPLISAILLLHSAFAALMDTATDGMIMDDVPPDALGRATALTRGGFVTGTAAGAALLSYALPALGLGGTAAILLALGAVLALLPLTVRERAGDALLSLRRDAAREAARLPALLRELGRELARPANLALLLFCAAQDFAGALFRVPLAVELVARGWTAEGLSSAQGGIGFAAGTAGALLVGWWADRAGASLPLALLLGAAAGAHLLAAPLMAASGDWVTAAGPAALALSTVTSALSFVALAPAVMRASRGPVAATRFALYMAALNLGDVLGSAAAGSVVGAVGLPMTAAVSGVILAAGAALAPRVVRWAGG